ncbi:hypothetical protein HPB48_003217 [Haemaphysalis longicornis]|uniref:TNF receptor-associated factor 6 n=1 Tax=Haemaphysalis longicornis TaxID=44386 RepID=A0A9J6FRM2_HAELO|nr:hypothetical protein HPB48_003217 [Haemaphysalis longicornis]
MPHEVRVRGFSELSEGLALDFLHPVPAEVTCSSCHDLVGILWLSPSCDHRFCTRCLEQLLGQASKSFCPVDQAEIFRGQLVEDTSVQVKASQFQVWCSNKEQGCTVTLRICDLREIQGERDMLRNQLNEVNASLKGLNLGFEHHCTHTASVQNELRHRVQQLEQQMAQLNVQGAPAQPQVGRLLSGLLATLLPQTWPPIRDSIRQRSHNLLNEKQACLRRKDEMITQADGQFRWLLKEYSRTRRHQRHGTHRYSSSPVFCTGMPGYRLQLRIHLNGMGQSRKGRFMAVQLVLLKGPHDAQLPWPFRHRVTITLVNQTGPQHVSYTINDPSFPRPQGDHTVPYVWQEFVAISDLEASPGLAWNDSLLFELSVTPPAPPPPGLYPPL